MHRALSISCTLILLFFCKKLFSYHLGVPMLSPTVASPRIVNLAAGLPVSSWVSFWGDQHRRQGKAGEGWLEPPKPQPVTLAPEHASAAFCLLKLYRLRPWDSPSILRRQEDFINDIWGQVTSTLCRSFLLCETVWLIVTCEIWVSCQLSTGPQNFNKW